jgi:uncharacterized membrane protein
MLGAFLALGVDTLVIIAALWYVGRLSGRIAGAVTVAILLVFSMWVAVRWIRLRLLEPSTGDGAQQTDDTEQQEPLDRLKQRYANGELSDAEFEERLDRLLDADRRAESANAPASRRVEQFRESE